MWAEIGIDGGNAVDIYAAGQPGAPRMASEQFVRLCGAGHKRRAHNPTCIVGVDGGEGTPVPIPNTAVKLTCADNTRLVTAREDKQTPTQKAHRTVCLLSLVFSFVGWRDSNPRHAREGKISVCLCLVA